MITNTDTNSSTATSEAKPVEVNESPLKDTLSQKEDSDVKKLVSANLNNHSNEEDDDDANQSDENEENFNGDNEEEDDDDDDENEKEDEESDKENTVAEKIVGDDLDFDNLIKSTMAATSLVTYASPSSHSQSQSSQAYTTSSSSPLSPGSLSASDHNLMETTCLVGGSSKYGVVGSGPPSNKEQTLKINSDDLEDHRDKLMRIYLDEFYRCNDCVCDTKSNSFSFGANSSASRYAFKMSKSMQRKLVSMHEILAMPNHSDSMSANILSQKGALTFKDPSPPPPKKKIFFS